MLLESLQIKDRQPGQIRRSHFCRSSAARAVDEPEPKPGIGTYTKLRTPLADDGYNNFASWVD